MMRNIRILVVLLFLPSIANALNVETHRAINERVGKIQTPSGFSLNQYLIDNLGISGGVEEPILNSATNVNQKISFWLRDGGEYEDVPAWYLPYVRSVNHFHNPINDQGFSGIWGTGFASGESAILWSQRAIGTQSPGGYYSWLDVRDYYYKALTATYKTIRDANFAQAFRGLGQLMHLVQDMSVPEHSRNDGHYLPTYEEWVAKPGNIDISTLNPFFFDMSALIQPSKFANAPVPIANLFDTNQYNGSNPNDTVSNTIGLSEYSNANFVSPQTLFKDFTYPSKTTSVQITDYDYPDPFNPGTYVKRQYYKKVADGETNQGNGYRLAGVDYLKFYRDANLSPTVADQIVVIPPMDEFVYSDYASLLLPRAVGYSAGLLNYFFRGTLEITAPDTYVYSIIDGSQNPQQFTKIKAKVRNTTPNEQIQNGVLQAVAKYKIIPNYKDDLSDYPPPPSATAMQNTPFSYSVSAAIPISSLDSINPQEFTFDFTNNPIPAGITDLYLIVVFKGTLGNEIDTAMAVGMKDIIEPTHHVIWNLTDMFVLYYQEANDPAPRYHLYTAEQIRSRPELAELIDYGEKGIFNQVEIGEPYIDPHDITIKIAYLSNPPDPLNPVPINPIAEVALPGGKHIRLITLLDDRKNNNNTHYYRITWWDKEYDPQPGQLKRWFPICGNSKDLIGSGDDINNEGFYCDYTYSRVQDQEEGSLFKYQEASSFRYWGSNNPIKQHRMDSGVLRFSPLPSGEWRYPEEESIPAGKTPEKATINFQ